MAAFAALAGYLASIAKTHKFPLFSFQRPTEHPAVTSAADDFTHPAPRSQARGIKKNPGGDLLSHRISPAVPSALEGLTSVFGMGTGVAPPAVPPENEARNLRHDVPREIRRAGDSQCANPDLDPTSHESWNHDS